MGGADGIPPEVLVEMLHRLPAKDLIRCRCVKKQWLSVIDDPSFIDKHLQYVTESGGVEHQSIIFLTPNSKHLYSVEMAPPRRGRKVRCPPMRSPFNIEIVGSCNGLLCLSSSSMDFVIWNPLTDSRASLPVPALPAGGDKLMAVFPACGFGYDTVMKDYRVVVIGHMFDERYRDVRIYSLLTNSWRRIQDNHEYMLSVLPNGRMGVYASNNLHWVMTRSSDVSLTRTRSIVAFELSTEEFREVPSCPERLDSPFGVDIAVLGGCLTLVVSPFDDDVVANVWMMREYGLGESWEKIYSISSSRQFDFPDLYYLHPSHSGGRLLIEGLNKKFRWFDVKSQRFVIVSVDTKGISCNAELWVGTLVRVDVSVGTQLRNRMFNKQGRTEEMEVCFA